MAKTKVDKAPYSADGSLLHYLNDGVRFSHYESDAGERLVESDIWEDIPGRQDEYGRWTHAIRRWKRDDWKRVMTEVDWRDNLPFQASLQIDHMMRGRSAKYVILKPVDTYGFDTRSFPMFVADLIDVAVAGLFQPGGIVSARWMVAKRGANYGLRLAKEDEVE